MGIRILESNSDSDNYAVLYCSTTMWAFGPVFDDRDEAEAFLEWYGRGTDIRLLTNRQLDDSVSRFRSEREAWQAEKAATEEAAWQVEKAAWQAEDAVWQTQTAKWKNYDD